MHVVPIGCFSGAGMKKVVVNSCPHYLTKLKGNNELFMTKFVHLKNLKLYSIQMAHGH